VKAVILAILRKILYVREKIYKRRIWICLTLGKASCRTIFSTPSGRRKSLLSST
jgi:hypothetical protein